MKKIELLSPAGSFEALEAAVMCGADAIYLGGIKFGARAFANNFDDAEMSKAVNYAHLYGVRIYVTVNTLIYDDEVSSFLDYIAFLKKIGVDAFIIQDIGMMHLLLTIYPDIELHASTQMHVHNIEALQRLKALGVKRAVLPRELSIDKVSELKKQSGIDIEIFIQGALCVSYSGQCLMSYLIGGRSGNRGECAGCCRLPYELIEVDSGKETIIDTKGKYLLSTKDLFTLDHISEIINSGVDSLKIEGRMKRPEYVALVTALYRRAIDNYYAGIDEAISEQDIINLKKMFNRGFTKGYLFGDKNNNLMNPVRPNHMGVPIGKVIDFDKKFITIKLTDNISLGDGIRIMSKEDIGSTISKMYKNNEVIKEAKNGDVVAIDRFGDAKVNDTVLKTTDVKLLDDIKKMYQPGKRKIMISGQVFGKINKPLTLTVTDGYNEVTVQSEIKITEANKVPVSKDVILDKLKKIGDTPYIFDKIDVFSDDNIFIPLTAINALKRDALDQLSLLRTKVIPLSNAHPYNIDISPREQEKVLWKAKVRTKEQYQACQDNNIDVIYIENNKLYQEVKDNPKVVLVLSRVRKTELNETDNMLVGELGSIAPNVTTDYSLNVVNAYAVAFTHSLGAKAVTLSYEMDIKRMDNILKSYYKLYSSKPNLEVIIYGRIEAMISEYCPLSTHINKKEDNCCVCHNSKKYYLRDRFDNDYALSFDNCMMTIYDYKKRNLLNDIDQLKKMGIKNFRYNFVDENYDECCKIIKELRSI